jgi:hypothetical protein
MRKLILTILILTICTTFSAGQNLVLNPSFEDTLDCPNFQNQIDYATGWSNYGESPDYFNSCSPNLSQFSVPNNWGGYQLPATGNAYAAFGTYASYIVNAREFIGAQLITPLITGTKYYVSFKVCLSISASIQTYIANNKTGVKITMNPYTWTSPPATNNFAHVYTDSIITDTTNWTTITGSFVADSNYQYIVLGNFFDDSKTDTITFINSSFSFAYYYLDDICVSTDSLTCLQSTGTNESFSKTKFKIYPNPTNQFATLEFNNPTKQNCTLILYNLQGQVVQKIKNITAEKVEIEKQNLSTGLYFFQLHTDRQIIANGKLTFE